MYGRALSGTTMLAKFSYHPSSEFCSKQLQHVSAQYYQAARYVEHLRNLSAVAESAILHFLAPSQRSVVIFRS